MNRGRLGLAFSFLLLLVLTRCSSVASGPGGFTPADESVAPTPAPATRPPLERLLAVLKAQGYDGIGLEFETDELLDRLAQVFTDPRTAKRKLRLIYTGMQLSYDAHHQSLTIDGTKDAESIIRFIHKQIPSR